VGHATLIYRNFAAYVVGSIRLDTNQKGQKREIEGNF
jgi:hypothetical protein